MSGNVIGVFNATATVVDASGNWWGSPMVPISDDVDYTPWLNLGTDTSTDPGFQGDFSSLTVDDLSTQTGSLGHIEEGLGLLTSGGTLYVSAGSYDETIDLNQDATVRANGDYSLSGDLNVQQGTFVAPSGSLALGGDFALSGGTFTHNGGTLVLDGSSAQSLGGAASAVFSSLTVNNASGVSLGIGERLVGTLTLTNGLFSLGGYDLTLGPAASMAGAPFGAAKMIAADGTGRLCKQFDAAGGFSYPVGDNTGTAEYTPASVAFTSGTFGASGQACVNLRDEKHPGHFSTNHLTRYWTVQASDISAFSADVTFNYVEDDVEGDEGELFTAKYDSGVWSAGNAVDTANNELSMEGISSFSDFTGKNDPTAVTLASFDATGYNGMVLIEWKTVLELDLIGYNIYRAGSPEGEREQINVDMIPTAIGSVLGASYAYQDTSVQLGETYYYWLEVVGVYGPEQTAGPVSTTIYTYLYMPLVVK
jgi:hypothetical protein